jgi:hypothetical protein
VSDRFHAETTRRTLMKALTGGAMAGPLLGATPGLTHAAPTPTADATRALFQSDGIPEEILASISTPDTVETRIGTLEFFDGLPSPETVQTVYDNLDFLRGVEVFLNAMPGASTYAIRQGIRSLGVPDNSLILFQDQADSAAIFLTANTESIYSWGFLDLTDGPVVMETPPNVLGIFDDMWFRYIADFGNAGPDQGQGGSFLILPPGFSGEIPDGYYTYSSPTYGVLIIFRGFAVDGDPAPAAESILANTRIYPLSEAQNRPETQILEVSGLPFNTVHPNDFTYYDEINHLIQEEPADALDPETTGLIASIGIVKGQEFKPDARMQAILKDSAAVANATARAILFRPRGDAFYFYPGEGSWYSPFVGGNYLFERNGARLLDARTLFFYFATGVTPAMTAARVGSGSQYAINSLDSDGNYLDGSKTYTLHLPPSIPAEDFWSIVLYDPQTRSMLQTDYPKPSVSSQTGAVIPNDDGSVDLWFGPEAPEGKEGNWAQTVPGKGWFVLLRLYGPGESWFDKTWRPGEFELVEE